MSLYVLIFPSANGQYGLSRINGGVVVLHFDSSVLSTADDLVGNKVNTVHFIRVTRQVGFNLVRFEVPNLVI